MTDPHQPLTLLSERATDYLLAWSALHDLDASALRETLQLSATGTIAYLLNAAERAHLNDQLLDILATIAVTTD